MKNAEWNQYGLSQHQAGLVYLNASKALSRVVLITVIARAACTSFTADIGLSPFYCHNSFLWLKLERRIGHLKANQWSLWVTMTRNMNMDPLKLLLHTTSLLCLLIHPPVSTYHEEGRGGYMFLSIYVGLWCPSTLAKIIRGKGPWELESNNTVRAVQQWN